MTVVMERRIIYMKRVVIILVTALLLVGMVTSSYAEVKSESAHAHSWVLDEIIDHGAYGFYYYTVNSCNYASYQHNHYRNRYMDEYVYVCLVCGEHYSDYRYTVGWDEPETCTLHDWGKKNYIIKIIN